MSQIKQLLRMHQQGNLKKEIARNLGISKNTVKSYLEKLEASGHAIEFLLRLDDPELEACFHSGNPAYTEEKFEKLKLLLDYYSSELKRHGVTKKLLWEEYKQAHPDGYEYSQFCFHLAQHSLARNPTMVLEHKPGDELYIDFAGKTMSYINPDTGESVKVQVFVATLAYSGYSFVLCIPSQKQDDFIYALAESLRFFGGSPQVLVPDNLKAAVVKSSKYEPEINKTLEDFANHYGITVIPARVRKPRDKSLVENRVGLNYTQIYARLRNQQFFSITDLNQAMLEKNDLFNQTRMQQKPYSRHEKFLAEEKAMLHPLPEKDFEIKYYRDYKVAQNNHIYLGEDKHYYSVPYIYIGQKVKVIYTRSVVHIYSAKQLIAAHVRASKGTYTTVKEHLCSHHQYYLDRSPEHYISKAKQVSPKLGLLFEKIFSRGIHPEQLYKTCDGLLFTVRKIPKQNIDKACDLCFEHGEYSYSFVKNLLTQKPNDLNQSIIDKPLPKHENVRGPGYYNK